MPGTQTRPEPGDQPQPAPEPERRRRGRVVLLVAGGLVLALLLTAGGLLLKLRGNITTVDVGDALADPAQILAGDYPPPKAGQAEPPSEPGEPLNILVMGSDTREGQGKGFGSAELIGGARSDTTLLVHLAADRESVTVLSFPRDLIVTLPSCETADGSTSYPYEDRFNAAFSIGGPECTIKTVTELTDLPIHHFVVVDFNGFTSVVDALGGVEVCLTEPVKDPLARLDLPAGVSVVEGEQALGFVRARTSLGDGSDLQRIERQQDFMASMVREVTSRALLTNPVRLYRTLDAGTQALTMDKELADLGRLVDLGSGAAGISPEDVAFVTYPNVYSNDFATVQPDRTHARPIIDAIAEDRPWPPPPAEGSETLTVAPGDITVQVVNATGRGNRATEAAAILDLLGFGVGGLSTADTRAKTIVVTDAASTEEAATVAASLGGVKVVEREGVFGVTLVLGRDYSAEDWRSVKVRKGKQKPWQQRDDTPPPGGTRTADVATCAS